MSYPLEIAIVSDEISRDFKKAVKIGMEWGINTYEVRELATGRIPFASDEDLKRLITTKEKLGIKINAISPGLFKCQLKDHEKVYFEMSEKLPKSIKLAKELGTRKIIVFSFMREDKINLSDYHDLLEIFRTVSEIAQQENLILCIENELNYYADNGENMGKIIRDVNSTALRVNWDPANIFGVPKTPFPNEYEHIKDYISNMHVKDYSFKNGEVKFVDFGTGQLDWKGQLKAIIESKKIDTITLETHKEPLIESSKCSYYNLKTLLSAL